MQSNEYWKWDQSANIVNSNEVGFKITRSNNSATLKLNPNDSIRFKIGLQAYVADDPDAIQYGVNEINLRFADYPSGTSASTFGVTETSGNGSGGGSTEDGAI